MHSPPDKFEDTYFDHHQLTIFPCVIPTCGYNVTLQLTILNIPRNIKHITKKTLNVLMAVKNTKKTRHLTKEDNGVQSDKHVNNKIKYVTHLKKCHTL